MTASRRLGPRDWIIAGLVALSEGGIEAVRVEKLARRLKTSKGSFYWHFADRPALLVALLDYWEAEGTHHVIASTGAIKDPAERLRALADAALIATEQGADVAHTEAALRAWAAEDATVGERIARVDEQRATYLSDTLKEMGYAPPDARVLGAGLYLSLMGLYSARRYAPALAEDQSLLALVDHLIAAAPGA